MMRSRRTWNCKFGNSPLSPTFPSCARPVADPCSLHVAKPTPEHIKRARKDMRIWKKHESSPMLDKLSSMVEDQCERTAAQFEMTGGPEPIAWGEGDPGVDFERYMSGDEGGGGRATSHPPSTAVGVGKYAV